MNQRAAFKELVDLMHFREMEEMPESPLGFRHLCGMLRRIYEDSEMSEAKIGRWLGWAQAAAVASGKTTLEEMKQLNMRHADD